MLDLNTADTDITGIAVGFGIVVALACLVAQILKKQKIGTEILVAFLSSSAIFIGGYLIYVSGWGDIKDLENFHWRPYLAISGLAVNIISINHMVKILRKIFIGPKKKRKP